MNPNIQPLPAPTAAQRAAPAHRHPASFANAGLLFLVLSALAWNG